MRLPFRLREGYQAFRSARLRVEQTRYRDLAEPIPGPATEALGGLALSESAAHFLPAFLASPDYADLTREAAG